MPTYDYQCRQCGHTWETFQSIKAKPLRKCPECRKGSAKRMIGPGAGILFKGSGFYLTDYRSDSYKQAAAADQKASEPAKPGGESKSGSESKSGGESKSSGASSSGSDSKPSSRSSKSDS